MEDDMKATLDEMLDMVKELETQGIDIRQEMKDVREAIIHVLPKLATIIAPILTNVSEMFAVTFLARLGAHFCGKTLAFVELKARDELVKVIMEEALNTARIEGGSLGLFTIGEAPEPKSK